MTGMWTPTLAWIAWLVHGQRKHGGLRKGRCGAVERPGIHGFHPSTRLAWEPSDVPSCVLHTLWHRTHWHSLVLKLKTDLFLSQMPKYRLIVQSLDMTSVLHIGLNNQFAIFRTKTITRLISCKYLCHCIFGFPNKVQISCFKKSL